MLHFERRRATLTVVQRGRAVSDVKLGVGFPLGYESMGSECDRLGRLQITLSKTSTWPWRVVIRLVGVWCCVVRSTAVLIVLQLDCSPERPSLLKSTVGCCGKKKRAKDLRDTGLRNMANGCDAGNANRSVGLHASSRCAETMLPY